MADYPSRGIQRLAVVKLLSVATSSIFELGYRAELKASLRDGCAAEDRSSGLRGKLFSNPTTFLTEPLPSLPTPLLDGDVVIMRKTK